MLVITRKKGDRFVIDWGDGCAVVSVNEIKGISCRLGIESSSKPRVFREELKNKIKPGAIASSVSFEDSKSNKRVVVKPIEFVEADNN